MNNLYEEKDMHHGIYVSIDELSVSDDFKDHLIKNNVTFTPFAELLPVVGDLVFPTKFDKKRSMGRIIAVGCNKRGANHPLMAYVRFSHGLRSININQLKCMRINRKRYVTWEWLCPKPSHRMAYELGKNRSRI